MNIYVYPTDPEWFRFLAAQQALDEINFWRPGGEQGFRQLAPGELLLFRLRKPDNVIAGGGFFVHFSFAPLFKAWEAFGNKNGTSNYDQFLRLIAKHKGLSHRPELAATARIGCIILASPFFLPRERWIPVPDDYPMHSPQGYRYDASYGSGRALFDQVTALLQQPTLEQETVSRIAERPRLDVWGEMALVRRRLHQGAFRLIVADIYEHRCAVTGERTLPVLEAAHIMPVSRGGQHRPDNGLLLRSDIHTLFDLGYVTVTKKAEFRVSSSLTSEWQNGKVYYALQSAKIRLPSDTENRPSGEFLEWHNDTVFRG